MRGHLGQVLAIERSSMDDQEVTRASSSRSRGKACGSRESSSELDRGRNERGILRRTSLKGRQYGSGGSVN